MLVACQIRGVLQLTSLEHFPYFRCHLRLNGRADEERAYLKLLFGEGSTDSIQRGACCLPVFVCACRVNTTLELAQCDKLLYMGQVTSNFRRNFGFLGRWIPRGWRRDYIRVADRLQRIGFCAIDRGFVNFCTVAPIGNLKAQSIFRPHPRGCFF